jgi:hypothetical protein
MPITADDTAESQPCDHDTGWVTTAEDDDRPHCPRCGEPMYAGSGK